MCAIGERPGRQRHRRATCGFVGLHTCRCEVAAPSVVHDGVGAFRSIISRSELSARSIGTRHNRTRYSAGYEARLSGNDHPSRDRGTAANDLWALAYPSSPSLACPKHRLQNRFPTPIPTQQPYWAMVAHTCLCISVPFANLSTSCIRLPSNWSCPLHQEPERGRTPDNPYRGGLSVRS